MPRKFWRKLSTGRRVEFAICSWQCVKVAVAVSVVSGQWAVVKVAVAVSVAVGSNELTSMMEINHNLGQ